MFRALLMLVLALTLFSACNNPPAISVSIYPPGPFSLQVRQSLQLSAQVRHTSNTAVTWSSSNPDVVTVSDGLVTAVGPGSATVRATSQADPSKSASVSIGVSAPPQPGPGSISGTVRIATTAGGQTARFVPGEILVRFEPRVSLQSVETLSVGGVGLQRLRPLSLANTYLYKAALDEAGTLAAVAALMARSDVAYAEPNYILKPFLTPNDPRYPDQWHYGAIRLPEAWDLETGSNSVRVAVIDSGVYKAHPDLAGRLLSGYDFVSDASIAGDGDGRDPDPEDTGLGSDFHGTHVTGTVGAATHNNTGVAGVAWGIGLVPIRALSSGGGTLADVADALRWAAGLSVAGVPANPNPADIINMSLGGAVSCAPASTMQQAINDVLAAGKMIVVAAGNSNADASTFTPAGCSGVITVGATDRSGNRAYYSNYGPRIDLMAPGGDIRSNAANGVLSTVGNGQYGFMQGTSMAAPHVAGVLALMKSRKSSLTPGEALTILKETARPLSAAQCNRSSGTDCGAGLIDARAALDRLATSAPALSLSATPASLSLNPGGNATIHVGVNRSNFSGPVTLTLGGQPSGIAGSFNPNPTSANSALSLSVGSGVSPGSYTLVVSGSGGGASAETRILLNVTPPQTPPPPTASLKGTLLTLYGVSGNTILCAEEIGIAQDVLSSPFSFTSLPSDRQYQLQGWKDVNNNGQADPGDLFAWYTEGGQVALLSVGRSDLELVLEPYVEPQPYTRPAQLFPRCSP
ncbi:S8 family serine peptidase [Meiothermus rufus]|uniref:S8 family serine peptidase n=1 Tax=Meiothermus rufus TaxID=604332 RepID=UPI00041A38CB|nr:S8 family serine peptidase [Meiothermus rufus]